MGKIDLTALCQNNEEFLKRLEVLKNEICKYEKYKDKLFNDAKTLLEFLEYDEKVSRELEMLYTYAHINSDLDLANNLYQEYVGKILNVYHDINEKTSFVIPEILEHSYDEFKDFCNKENKLTKYDLSFKRIFRKQKYIKSKKEEELISILTSSYSRPEEISELLTNTDLDYGFIKDEDGNKVHLTNSNYSTYLESTDRNVRKDTFKKLYDAFKKHENTYSAILATQIINDNKIAKIRNFEKAKDLSLYASEVDLDVYDKLIEGVNKNLDKFYGYYELKQKIMGLKDFHIYDTYASITKDSNKNYSYEEAQNILMKALKPLGENYLNDLSKSFSENWIDSRIIKRKRSGAYCTACYDTHPYVVTSYEGKINDISTLAHELGHAMHYYYAIKNNTYEDYNYSIFVAEVASQVNEIILTDYLLKNAKDDDTKKYLLDLILQRFKSTIIRQTMFAQYEETIHDLEKNGEVLTNEVLINTYYGLNKKYFGKNVILDDLIKYECYRIPHFYYNFYVYQYATGYAAALKIANGLINNDKKMLENYLKFLKLGSTLDPVKSLAVVGIDMHDENLYDEVFEIFGQKLNELRGFYE